VYLQGCGREERISKRSQCQGRKRGELDEHDPKWGEKKKCQQILLNNGQSTNREVVSSRGKVKSRDGGIKRKRSLEKGLKLTKAYKPFPRALQKGTITKNPKPRGEYERAVSV